MSDDTPTPTDWLTVGQVAARLHVARSTVYLWIDAGLPTHKPGGRRLFDASEVDAWIRNRCFTRQAVAA